MKIKAFFRKIKTFLTKFDNKSKGDFIRAFIYCGIARMYILFFPFNKLKKRMGKVKAESPEVVDINTVREARNIGRTVLHAASYTPWQSKCLVQALAAQWMLKRKGISTTIYLGVKKDKQNNMLAHAWTRCGSYYVTGGYNRQGYAVVAKFAS